MGSGASLRVVAATERTTPQSPPSKSSRAVGDSAQSYTMYYTIELRHIDDRL